MNVWFASRWESFRANFWFVPTVMVVGAVALSFAMVRLDRATPEANWIATLGWTFTRGPEGSRAVLSAVAGSMMTITSVTFSITVVALQLASTQFGPRLLRNFMKDNVNQVSLGAFIATFAYCLLVLRTVNGTEGQSFVPHISVTVGLALALASLGILIYFIHHAAASIQAENVVAAVGRELVNSIGRLFPREMGQGPPEIPGVAPPAMPPGFPDSAAPVGSAASDYIEAIDVESLMGLAVDRDLVLHLPRRPGLFVLEGEVIARVWPADRLDDDLARAIRGAFYLGPRRTLTQDVEFAIDQLVEVALRALSPGVNDPFTAISCVDRLGAGLRALAAREIPSESRFDDSGRLRVVVEASTASGIVDAAFHQIRQAARGNAAVTLRLLETIAALMPFARDPELACALLRHAELVRRGSVEGLPDPDDRAEVGRRVAALPRSLRGT